MYNMCYGFLDEKWEDCLIPIEKGEHEEAMILNLVYRKDRWIFLDFLSFPRQ